jgi:hypothetical protein
MGAFFLLELDARIAKSGLFYVRFMDDILVLAPTRSKLRSAVRAVNSMLASLRLEKHPDKTFIGKIARGFDYLGYHFCPGILKLADTTIERFVAHATRLYEQGRQERIKAPLLGKYVRRWQGWAKSAVMDSGSDKRIDYTLSESIAVAFALVPCRREAIWRISPTRTKRRDNSLASGARCPNSLLDRIKIKLPRLSVYRGFNRE